jgi:DNA-binding NtrC family response regulator
MRILVVEDEPAIRETIRLGLEDHTGFLVETATGDGDVDPPRAASADLVVMDMHLGGPLDGLDLIEEISALNPRVRFLVISGRREVEIASRIIAASRTDRVVDVLLKPFSLEQLTIAVDRAIGLSPEREPKAPESA